MNKTIHVVSFVLTLLLLALIASPVRTEPVPTLMVLIVGLGAYLAGLAAGRAAVGAAGAVRAGWWMPAVASIAAIGAIAAEAVLGEAGRPYPGLLLAIAAGVALLYAGMRVGEQHFDTRGLVRDSFLGDTAWATFSFACAVAWRFGEPGSGFRAVVGVMLLLGTSLLLARSLKPRGASASIG